MPPDRAGDGRMITSAQGPASFVVIVRLIVNHENEQAHARPFDFSEERRRGRHR
jgi:hypothetical protein